MANSQGASVGVKHRPPLSKGITTVAHDGMRFWERLQVLLGFSHPPQTEPGKSAKPTAVPKKEDVKVIRLNAASKMALSKALRGLEPGQKGWISFDDAARLFSPSTKNPKDWNEARIKALTDFAVQAPNGTRPLSASISLEYGR